MDVGQALRFPFEDRDWIVKILIGGILLLIPIVCFFVFGYTFKVLQKAAREGVYELPAWKDWGSLFEQGFYVFLVFLIYFLIPAIVFGCSFLAWIAPYYGGAYYGAAPLAVLGILFFVLGGIIGFAAALIAPMALTVYAATGEFGQAFNFGEIFSRVGSNAGNYVVALVIYLGLSILIGIIASVPVLGIIAIFASFYVAVVMSYLFGDVYRGDASSAPPAAPPI